MISSTPDHDQPGSRRRTWICRFRPQIADTTDDHGIGLRIIRIDTKANGERPAIAALNGREAKARLRIPTSDKTKPGGAEHTDAVVEDGAVCYIRKLDWGSERC